MVLHVQSEQNWFSKCWNNVPGKILEIIGEHNFQYLCMLLLRRENRNFYDVTLIINLQGEVLSMSVMEESTIIDSK